MSAGFVLLSLIALILFPVRPTASSSEAVSVPCLFICEHGHTAVQVSEKLCRGEHSAHAISVAFGPYTLLFAGGVYRGPLIAVEWPELASFSGIISHQAVVMKSGLPAAVFDTITVSISAI